MADAATHWKGYGSKTVSPMMFVQDAEAVVAFAQAVFDAQIVGPVIHHNDGRLWHVTLEIEDSTLMLGAVPQGAPETKAFLHVYVSDADAVYQRALDNGAQAMMPLENQFYGDRSGGVTDKAGNVWWIATHIEDLTEDQLTARARAADEARGAAA